MNQTHGDDARAAAAAAGRTPGEGEDLYVPRNVERYDGSYVWVGGRAAYEVSNYLGGGAAGVVYETIDCDTGANYALKILHPIGYKLLPPRALPPCIAYVGGPSPAPHAVCAPSSRRSKLA